LRLRKIGSAGPMNENFSHPPGVVHLNRADRPLPITTASRLGRPEIDDGDGNAPPKIVCYRRAFDCWP
jgi:hypothetical protein